MATPTQPIHSSSSHIVPAVKKGPAFFALIIGINKYTSSTITPLNGAIDDAEAIKQYLETTLHVPATQIKTLYDAEATRSSIIRELTALSTHPQIQIDDPILIFFAGHGGTASSTDSLIQSEIQLILPYDYCDVKGSEVHGIPDRTFGVLLKKVANAKGDNITVIFDCCHSGSGTRHPTRLVRGVKTSMKIPSEIDRDITSGSRETSIPSGFLYHGLKSHVLLAACGAEENAKEENGRGYFTEALIKTLGVVDTDKVTYTDLINQIPNLPLQNPQCEGHNRTRTLFNSKAPGQNRQLFPVFVKKGKYVMSAGAAHGIAEGAEFAIYKDRASISNGTPLGTLKASEPKPFFTDMIVPSGQSPFTIEEQAFAVQTRIGKEGALSLHIAMDQKLMSIFEAVILEIQGGDAEQNEIRLVPTKDEAELDIRLDDEGLVTFDILDPLVTRYGLTRMPFRARPTVEEMCRVVRGAARYYWHLRRTSKLRTLGNKVNIELNPLDVEYDDELNPVIQLKGSSIIQEGVAELTVDPEAIYGVRIENKTAMALYASVFYFDCSSFSIMSYFQPPIARGKADAPLPPRGALEIGYGVSDGSTPFTYSLREGQDVDVGFMKIFLSTEQVDLSGLEQTSPFEGTRGPVKTGMQPPAIWDVILIPIVQRKYTPKE